jgi:hypothetical protein
VSLKKLFTDENQDDLAGDHKKFEPLWNFMIKSQGLNKMLPLLEAILSKVGKTGRQGPTHPLSPFPAIA